MNGTAIESLLAVAVARSSRAQQRITAQLDFTVPGMKTDREIRDFLLELELAGYDLVEASAALQTIRTLYREARP